jgi:hypothetical protein
MELTVVVVVVVVVVKSTVPMTFYLTDTCAP